MSGHLESNMDLPILRCTVTGEGGDRSPRQVWREDTGIPTKLTQTFGLETLEESTLLLR